MHVRGALFLTADRGPYCRTGSDYVVLGLLELVDLTSAVDSLDVGLGDIWSIPHLDFCNDDEKRIVLQFKSQTRHI
jgi:hypothetical protein